MKKIISTAILVLALQSICEAQIKVPSLNGLKDKVTEKATTKPTTKPTETPTSKPATTSTSSSSTSTSSTSTSSKEEPEYNPDDPTFRAYSVVRDEVSSIKNVLKNWGSKSIEVSNNDATRYIANANASLAKLQNDPKEAKKNYVKNYATELANLDAERKGKFESYEMDEVYDKKVGDYFNFATLGWEIQDKSLEPSYTGYYNFKKEFQTKRPEKYKDEYVQRRIVQIDNFFKVEVYKVVPYLNGEVDKIISEIHEKNSRNEESYMLNAKHYLKDFDKPQEDINYNKKYLLEDKTGIDAVQSKIDKELAMLNEYINSGKYEAHVAQYRQEIIDAVRLRPKMMSNDSYEKMAREGVTKGKVARVVIVSSAWEVAKTEYGFPLYKFLRVDLAVTDVDGKCMSAYGQIRKTYEGGGVYGDEFFYYWGLQDEMNCSNINK